jgi:hypothetical protein
LIYNKVSLLLKSNTLTPIKSVTFKNQGEKKVEGEKRGKNEIKVCTLIIG